MFSQFRNTFNFFLCKSQDIMKYYRKNKKFNQRHPALIYVNDQKYQRHFQEQNR